jgi:hypothetical protein
VRELATNWHARERAGTSVRESKPMDSELPAPAPRIECGFRVLDGDVPGLSRRWIHGVATLQPGEITFRRSLALGLRIPRPFTPLVQIVVAAVEPSARPVGLREAWSVNRGAHLLRVTVGDRATVEWAVPADQQARAVEQVTVPKPH